MNARERGARSAGLITAVLAATAVGGTAAVIAITHAQESAATTQSSTTSDTSSTSDQSTLDSSSSSNGMSSSSGETHAQSGGS
jgi:cytoskeletal protein RodZ